MKYMNYSFPAIRGEQAKSEYYACMIPLELLSKIFIDTDNDAPAEYRAQRRINESRIPSIKQYVLDNRDSYVFSSLTASIDGNIRFIPSEHNEDIGILEISMKSKLLINDGQHRKAALISALEEDPSLAEETISVVLYKDKGLEKSQQMFTDLNKHAVNTSKSLNALYDSKDVYSLISKQVLKEVPFLNRYTDKEKDILGKFSQMLFTLSNFVNANKKVIKICKQDDMTDEQIINFLTNYWNLVCDNIDEWNELLDREISKKELRENYIITQGVSLLALGLLAEYFYLNPKLNIEKHLQKLRKIDWSRTNEKDWFGSAIKMNGRINRSDKGINLTYLRIKKLIGLTLTNSEENLLEGSKL